MERDKNIKTLLQDIHDVFALGKLAHTLKTLKFDSKQAQILTDMLRHVCNCGDFIQSYAKDPEFCMSSPSNLSLALNLWFSGQRMFTLKSVTGKDDSKIEDYRTTLLRLRDLFVHHAIVTTEITALQILDDIGGICTQLGGISTQITTVSTQISDASAYS